MLEVNRVKSDLESGGMRVVGGTLEVQELAWKWVQMKEAQLTKIATAHAAASRLTVIADSRIAELRALTSTQFDFKKLIRLCEEINTALRPEPERVNESGHPGKASTNPLAMNPYSCHSPKLRPTGFAAVTLLRR
jgi:hypothetical protein